MWNNSDVFFSKLIERQTACGANGLGGFDKHYFTLFGIVTGLEAKACFEFGMGWSTVVILEAMLQNGGGRLISCDPRPCPAIVRNPLGRYQYMLEHYQYLSSEITNFDSHVFDFVLHDGSHEMLQVEKDLQNIIPRMRKNSILCIHDTNNSLYPDLKEFVKGFEYEMITLPYGGGLTVIKIDADFGHGEVTQTWSKK